MSQPGRLGGEDPLPPDLVVPEDARGLEGDLRAWRREQAAAARWARFDAVVGRRWRRYASPGLVLGLVIAAVTAVGVGLVLVAPIGLPTSSAARPLAAPAARPGTVGGLLPATAVRVGQADRPVRNLRPAVLTVLPRPCRCAAPLAELAAAAGQYGLPLVLVTVAGNDELAALLAAARTTRSYPAYDPAAVLARTYAVAGLTAVLVRADGVVTAIERRVAPGRRWSDALSQLAR